MKFTDFTWLMIFLFFAHILLLYSIFDVYFTSPLIQNIPARPMLHKPLANRLVLIVLDGMRADRFYGDHMQHTPYLRSVLLNRASWGISNTHVPTESRPGIVSITAGFYEDVSAVAKGWQENAMQFDSIFNQSVQSHIWGFESLRKFYPNSRIVEKDGDEFTSKEKIHIHMYPANISVGLFEEKAWVKDEWVFSDAKRFFDEARKHPDRYQALHRYGNIVYFHLIGMDFTGHIHKPRSKQYIHNLKVVDKGLSQLLPQLEEFFDDSNNDEEGRTAFVLTADHGMTEWGSHGMGSFHETMTPLMVWGSGIVRPPPLPSSGSSATPASASPDKQKELDRLDLEKGFSEGRGLPNNLPMFKLRPRLARIDIEQADICPLMAALLAIPIPINSVGQIPLDLLNTLDSTKASIVRSNFLQIENQFKAKMREKQSSSVFSFKEFPELTQTQLADLLAQGQSLIDARKFKSAMELFSRGIRIMLRGIRYYHTYDRASLGFAIGLSYAAMILLLLTRSFELTCGDSSTYIHPPHFFASKSFLALLLLSLNLLVLFVGKRPVSHCLYYSLALLLSWRVIVFHVYTLLSLSLTAIRAPLYPLLIFLIVECIVASFFQRVLLVFGLVANKVWMLHETYRCKSLLKFSCFYVCVFSCLLALFPALPTIQGYTSLSAIFAGGIFNLAFHLVYTKFAVVNKTWDSNFAFNKLQLICSVLSPIMSICCKSVASSNSNLKQLLYFIRIINWIYLIAIVPLLLWRRTTAEHRLFSLFMALSSVYILLSIYYEAFFIFVLILYCYCWIQNERDLTQLSVNKRRGILNDIRRIVDFIFLIVFSFFATGNIASLNSFDINSLLCFVGHISEFCMVILLLVKIMIPILIVALAFATINQNVHKIQRAAMNSAKPHTNLLPEDSRETSTVTLAATTPTTKATKATPSSSNTTWSDPLSSGKRILQRVRVMTSLALADLIALQFFFLIRDSGSWLDIGESISHYVTAVGFGLFIYLIQLAANKLIAINSNSNSSNSNNNIKTKFFD